MPEQDDFIQIKDLNRLESVKNTDLLLLDDGISSCHAITYENFLETSKDKIFKNEGLKYFKEVIKTTIATELLQDENFINQVYSKVLTKFLNDDSSSISNTYSKVKDRLGSGLSSYDLRKDDYFVTLSYSSLQKAQIPKHLTGIPSGFDSSRTKTTSSYIYESSLRSRSYILDMTSQYSNQQVDLVFYKSEDGDPIYLDIYVDSEINASGTKYTKKVILKYTDESQGLMIYYRGAQNAYTDDYGPLFTGWYMQKRTYRNGSPVPILIKL
ncbi:Putative cytosolic protein (plasmid) [Borrelia nietonii YOR]|uniref:Putative cytosolic protein n=1 Tax=Borrelia nietonii YOR TaxID=1293576 RepID=W5SB94_9SPIR|nr:DUF685 domain-containing protein [Borrelia nietonii]AHH04232.1 Putative cytosolic protein [Borrelia nietonii YOR]UPA09601.1 DUF685 domain-containing protein [Borrelia nietonii YOR]